MAPSTKKNQQPVFKITGGHYIRMLTSWKRTSLHRPNFGILQRRVLWTCLLPSLGLIV